MERWRKTEESVSSVAGEPAASDSAVGRRKLLLGVFLSSLAGAYGGFAVFAAKFIFPERSNRPPSRIFLGFASKMGVGQSRSVTMPSGDQLLLSNTGKLRPGSESTFTAFSNRCPHLGCKVHFRAQEEIFECPCHQGVFDSNGVAVSGPPAQAGQSLTPYPLSVDGDSIYAVVEDA